MNDNKMFSDLTIINAFFFKIKIIRLSSKDNLIICFIRVFLSILQWSTSRKQDLPFIVSRGQCLRNLGFIQCLHCIFKFFMFYPALFCPLCKVWVILYRFYIDYIKP